VKQLDILMASDSHHKRGISLDHLYATALRCSRKWGSGTFTEDFCDILGTTILGRVPLTDGMMDSILGLEGDRSSKFIYCIFGVSCGGIQASLFGPSMSLWQII